MEDRYDIDLGIRASKAEERMLGFSVFTRPLAPSGTALEGMVKIAAFRRPDGSGYLTLTFLIDREDGASLPPSGRWIGPMNQAALQAWFGPRFEMAMDLDLHQEGDPSSVWIEEMDLYFRPLEKDLLAMVGETLFPALSESLGLRFGPLESWPDPKDTEAQGAVVSEATWLARLRRWLGGV